MNKRYVEVPTPCKVPEKWILFGNKVTAKVIKEMSSWCGSLFWYDCCLYRERKAHQGERNMGRQRPQRLRYATASKGSWDSQLLRMQGCILLWALKFQSLERFLEKCLPDTWPFHIQSWIWESSCDLSTPWGADSAWQILGGMGSHCLPVHSSTSMPS